MSWSPQFDCDRFRVLLFRKGTSEILVQETDQGSALPSLEIPSHSRVAEKLTAAIETLWGLSVYCLFALPDTSTAGPVQYQVAELQGNPGDVPTRMRWTSVNSLTDSGFANHTDLAALQAALGAFGLFRCDKPAGPFGKPGWLQVVAGWAAAQAAALGFHLTGKVRQLNASPAFSLIRFESNGPALWFKAVGEPNLHEYGITLELARRFPRYLPRVVASRLEWNAWLSVEAAGTHLGERSATSDWMHAAAALADLQIASFGSGHHLIGLGCKDVRAPALFKRVDPFFGRMARFMKTQTKASPAPLTEVEMARLTQDIRCALSKLGESDVANAIGHLDCNPENVLVSRRRTVFLDWAEGCVGHPFFTFQYLLEHWRRFHGSDRKEEEALLATYTAPWKSFISPRRVARDLRLIPLAAAFAYVASGSGLSQAAVRPETAGFLRSITRRMKREADALSQGKLLCVR
jgi:hypothetical protein